MVSQWRLIVHGDCDPHWNMAVDEAILQSYIARCTPPTLRFYGWITASISLGRFQSVEKLIDCGFCQANNIPLVRRPTGGRAVLHGTDLTFSVVRSNDNKSVQESYAELSAATTDALIAVGAPVEPFQEVSGKQEMRNVANCFLLKAGFEVALDGRKILGSAQVRTQDAVLQQNSLLLDAPRADNHNAFIGVCPKESCACIAQYAGKSDVLRSICNAIQQKLGVTLRPSELTPDELQEAEDLMRRKYVSDEWNLCGRSKLVDNAHDSVLY